MSSQPLPRDLTHKDHRGARYLSIAMLVVGAAVLVAPPSVPARLIPPSGPWPMPVAGALNPLVGTPFVLNGSHATENASLRAWLPIRGRRRSATMQTVGRHTVVRGRLRNRDSHRSIAGATLTIAVQNVYEPTSWGAVMNVRTNRRGQFRAVVAPGYHRRVAVLYYAGVTSATPIASRRLLIRARSRVALSRPLHKGRAYRFDGHVSAGALPVPAEGLLLGLQVRNSQHRWVTPRFARTTASGRFRIRYRFPRSAPLAVRVIAPAQTGWPLYAGYSRPRTIRPR